MSFDTDLVAAMRTSLAASYKYPARNPPSLYATYQRITGRKHGTLNSGLGAPKAIFQIDVWGSTFGPVREAADALKDAVVGSLKVGELTDNPDDFEQDTQLHRASFDVTLW